MPFNPDIQRALKGHVVKPPTIKDKLTNRELRGLNFLSLARRTKPQMVKALKTMVDLLAASDTPGVRFQAAKFIIEFYMDVVKSLYKEKYDADKNDDIQPIFQVIDGGNVVQVPEPEAEKQLDDTNRRLREKQLLMLSRKLKPHVKSALDTINELIEKPEIAPAVKFQASKFMLVTNKTLTESIYADKYDEEEQVEEEQKPVFSLRMISNNS